MAEVNGNQIIRGNLKVDGTIKGSDGEAIGSRGSISYPNATNQQITDNVNTDITSLTGKAFPTTPNGIRKFLVSYQIRAECTDVHDRSLVGRLYMGTTGDKGDTLVDTVTSGKQNASNEVGLAGTALVTPSGTGPEKLGLALQQPEGGTTTIFGGDSSTGIASADPKHVCTLTIIEV